jgi:hypothetical protein
MTLKVQHKRSAVKGKQPLPTDLEFGEIAVNYEASSPALYIKDSAGAIRRIGSQPGALVFRGSSAPTATAPTAPQAGDVYLMTADGTMAASWVGVAGRAVVKGENIAWTGTEWESLGSNISPDATTTAKGIVQLADAAAITAGTAGRVVDAAQLKANVPTIADATTTAKGVVQLADAAAIAAGTAGRVVDAAQLKAKVPTIANATTTVKGIVQLADAAAITAGTAGRVVDAAQLKDAITFGTGTCRAWVNFNGTGTVAIRASYNVSSITDHGTGDYRVNFTSALSDANYAIAGFTIGVTAGTLGVVSARNTFTPDAGYCSILAGRPDSGGVNDVHHVHAAFFR